MTTTTQTLADFLLARIAEDEAAALQCAPGLQPGEWRGRPGWDDEAHWSPITSHIERKGRQIARTEVRYGPNGYGSVARGSEPVMHHIARHDPARVLAECEAKRRIVEAHSAAWEAPWADDSVQRRYAARGRTAGLYDALRALALPYADHAEFREEWRP